MYYVEVQLKLPVYKKILSQKNSNLQFQMIINETILLLYYISEPILQVFGNLMLFILASVLRIRLQYFNFLKISAYIFIAF